MKQITVLLVDDNKTVRDGFRKLIEADDGIEVVGEARNGRQAVSLVKKLRPDVVLMDISMPGMNGLEATRLAIKNLPATKVIIHTVHNDFAYVQAAAEVGAVAFLLKQTSPSNVCQAIRDAHNGKTFVITPSSI